MKEVLNIPVDKKCFKRKATVGIIQKIKDDLKNVKPELPDREQVFYESLFNYKIPSMTQIGKASYSCYSLPFG